MLRRTVHFPDRRHSEVAIRRQSRRVCSASQLFQAACSAHPSSAGLSGVARLYHNRPAMGTAAVQPPPRLCSRSAPGRDRSSGHARLTCRLASSSANCAWAPPGRTVAPSGRTPLHTAAHGHEGRVLGTFPPLRYAEIVKRAAVIRIVSRVDCSPASERSFQTRST